MKLSITQIVLLGAPLASAVMPPSINGLKNVWSESFTGCAGCSPNADEWNIALDVNTNNEVQTYTSSSSNIQLSGGQTLQLVPWKSDAGAWTSGRIETKDSWTPAPGKVTRIQGALRLGDNLQKAGMWPAFWALGDAMRHGTEWPLCGELDIFEQVNGDMTAYGTAHCGVENGGACNEPSGRGASTPLADNEFHTWSLVIDRTAGSWQAETIQWLADGVAFNTLSGADIGDEGTWSTLAHSPYYILLNVAVGGAWPVSLLMAPSSEYRHVANMTSRALLMRLPRTDMAA